MRLQVTRGHIQNQLEVLAGAISWGFKSPSPHHDLKKLKGHRATDGLYLFGHVSGLKSSRIYVGRLQMHECMCSFEAVLRPWVNHLIENTKNSS